MWEKELRFLSLLLIQLFQVLFEDPSLLLWGTHCRVGSLGRALIPCLAFEDPPHCFPAAKGLRPRRPPSSPPPPADTGLWLPHILTGPRSSLFAASQPPRASEGASPVGLVCGSLRTNDRSVFACVSCCWWLRLGEVLVSSSLPGCDPTTGAAFPLGSSCTADAPEKKTPLFCC